VKVSRTKVKEIIAANTDEVPPVKRELAAAQHRARIVAELAACNGNQVRVHEELVNDGVDITYNALTYFVRKNNLLKPPPLPAGRYPAEPGVEAQHDTSPHDVKFKDGKRRCQCASLILAYSRMLYFQYAPRFTRFECKLFLTEALQYFDASFEVCIVDNTNVVILHGTGKDAVMTPEMENFGERFGFRFQAHEVGDANRSGKIERPFHYIENNFLNKRTFKDFDDLNRQAREFCDRNNSTYKKHLKAIPVELFAAERNALKPLPPYIPPVYRLFHRTVDLEGFVNLHAKAYSVPYELIGQRVEVRETRDRIQIFLGPREVASHQKIDIRGPSRSTHKEHRPKRSRTGLRARQSLPEEKEMREHCEALNAYVDALKKRSSGRAAVPIKRLYRMMEEYPAEPFDRAVTEALHFNMTDLERLDKMVLRNIAGEYFRLPMDETNTEEDNE
jgi:transposase